LHRDIFEITNKGLGFKLTDSTSFDELLFSAGFIEKTTKGDLFVKRNGGNPRRKIHENTLEGKRRQTTTHGPKRSP